MVARCGFYLETSQDIDILGMFIRPLDFCLECLYYGADCKTDNSAHAELPFCPGLWRDSNNTAEFYPTQKLGFTRLQLQIGDIYCADNHTGPLCEVCINNDAEVCIRSDHDSIRNIFD